MGLAAYGRIAGVAAVIAVLISGFWLGVMAKGRFASMPSLRQVVFAPNAKSAKAEHEVDVSPPLLTIRKLGSSSEPFQPISVFSPRGEAFAVRDARTDIEGVIVRWDKDRFAPRHLLHVDIGKLASKGSYTGNLTILTTHPRRPQLHAQIEAVYAPADSAVAPKMVQLGTVEPGSIQPVRLVAIGCGMPAGLARADGDVLCTGKNWRVEKARTRDIGANSVEYLLEVRVPQDLGWHRSAIVIHVDGAPVEVPIWCKIDPEALP